MIRFRALGVQFRLPLLALLTPLLAAKLGMRANLPAMAIALSAHELAHLLAARLAGVEIAEIQLLPFGGSAKMENPYRIPPARLVAVALAGPAANLALIVLCAALTQWGLVQAASAAALFQMNLTLMLFNLLPALPLDGGRILYALLQRPLGESRALRLGIWLGRVLAAALLAAAVGLGFRSGKWNLTLILAAVFLLASGPDESAAWARSRAQRLGDALESAAIRPVRILQLPADTYVSRALELLRPRELCWFLLTDGGNPRSLLDERSLLRHLIDGGAPEATLGELQAYRLPPTSRSGASGVHI